MPDDKPKVVILDVDSVLHAELERSLSPLYEVSALRGEWTYAQIVAEDPALLLLDVSLPEKGAFELCRSLRCDPRFAKTPIIFLAGAKTDEDYRRYLGAGGSRFLNKLISRRHLLAALGEELAAAKSAAPAR